MPGLSPEAEILAYSEWCPRQIVRYTPNVYGFQCHMEFNSQVMEGLIEEFEDEISDESHKPYVQSVSELRSKDYDQMNEFLFRFLDYFTKS